MGKTGRALNDGIKSFVDNNVTEAIRLLTPLAAVGYEAAQLNLAYIYKVPACLQSHVAVFHDRQLFFPRKSLVEVTLRFLLCVWLLVKAAPKLSLFWAILLIGVLE